MEEDWYCADVLTGTAQVERVAENDDALAFRAPNPLYPVHIIVIPKRHIRSLADVEADGEAALLGTLELVREVAAGVESAHGACQVFTNLGEYQHNKHLHWHVVVFDAYPEP